MFSRPYAESACRKYKIFTGSLSKGKTETLKRETCSWYYSKSDLLGQSFLADLETTMFQRSVVKF